LVMNPSDTHALELRSWIERRQGDFDARVESILEARVLDPRNPKWTIILVDSLMISHRYTEAKLELENTTIQQGRFAHYQNLMELREHQDLKRWRNKEAEIAEEFESPLSVIFLWEAEILNRNYLAAESLLGSLKNRGLISESVGITEIEAFTILTQWFKEDQAQLGESLAQARSKIEQSQDENGDFVWFDLNLQMALVTASEGKREETERLVRRWERLAVQDKIVYAVSRHRACRILGSVKATNAAVECIRAGLENPSLIMPFLEPHFPFYDAIRDQPEFQQLVADMEKEPHSSG